MASTGRTVRIVAILVVAIVCALVAFWIYINPELFRSGRGALHGAALNGDIERLEELLRRGEEIDQYDAHGRSTALGVAAAEGHLEVVRFLISRGADVNEGCPLYDAAAYNQLTIASVLLDEGADPNLYALEGCPTPLLAATRNGHAEMVQFLIERGARLPGRDCAFHPLLVAAKCGHGAVVRCLVGAGAAPDTPDDYSRRTALHYVAESGDAPLVRWLLAKGARFDIRDRMGEAAEDVARRLGHTDVVDAFEGARKGEQTRRQRE